MKPMQPESNVRGSQRGGFDCERAFIVLEKSRRVPRRLLVGDQNFGRWVKMVPNGSMLLGNIC